MLLEVFGVFLAALIQGIFISIYGSKVSCDQSTLAHGLTPSYNNLTTFIDESTSTSTKSNQDYSKLVKINKDKLKKKIKTT